VTSFKGNRERSPTKQKSINAYEKWKWCCASPHCSITDLKDQVCPFPNKPDPTPTQLLQNDDKPTNVIGAGVVACYTGIKVKTVPSPINGAIPWPQGDVWYPSTIVGTTHSSMPLKPAYTKVTTKGCPSVVSMPEWLRLKHGNEPNTFGRDSPVWRMGHWSDEIGAVGSATEAETEQCVGSGAPFTKDSGLNFPLWIGSRPWMGGNDTILTPFSLSPVTDTAVDSLPALFLAYCTITDSDDVVSIDDRVVPRPLASGIHPPPLVLDDDPLVPLSDEYLNHLVHYEEP
jgi:hypothetical protein